MKRTAPALLLTVDRPCPSSQTLQLTHAPSTHPPQTSTNPPPTHPSLLEKAVDLNALFTLAAPIMHLMPDFQSQLKAERQAAAAR